MNSEKMSQTETHEHEKDISEMLLNEPSAAERKRLTYYWPFAVALAVILFDQITKLVVEAALGPIPPGQNVAPGRIDLLGGFAQIIFLINRGASFGFLSGTSWGWLIFTILAFVVSGFIIYWYTRYGTRDRWLQLGVGLVLGGIIGNLIDRIFEGGGVRDIITIPSIPLFRVFNAADSGITVGVTTIIVSMLLRGLLARRKRKLKKQEQE
jgi:signal peptidase II